MAESGTNWRDLFVGRKAELDWLKERWAKALDGEPQLVVLLAETGLGKTRIAQEFYRWLSREQDPAQADRPEGYWPDAFGSDRESLDVNPSFVTGTGSKGEIPWLWWGLRWEDPGKRNLIDDRCALSTYRSALLPHTQAIETKKNQRGIFKDTILTLGELALAQIPGIAQYTETAAKAKELKELLQDYFEVKKLGKESELDIASRQKMQESKLKDEFLHCFRIILNPSKRDAITVPVILMLDDAQWADSTSLAFVRELFAEAHRNHWKLVVILTHWEQEWNAAPCEIDPKAGTITYARQLPVVLGLADDWASHGIRIVHPLPEAEEIVIAAFPGLTDRQRNMVVEKSGGNAEMLKEALLWFESEPRFFVRNDRNNPLSEVGEKRLAEREFELTQFIQKRYDRLSDKVQLSLGWSSIQGTRFLADITRAAADSLISSDSARYTGQIDSASVTEALSQAEHPHSWIGFEGDRARQNLAIFRQRVFWEIANDDLGFDPEERFRVEYAIREVLTNWLHTGKLDALPSAERLDALLIARSILRPADGELLERRLVWSRMLVRLFQEYQAEFLEIQALEVAREWFDARPKGGWSFEDIPFWDQFAILMLLYQRQDRSRRRIFVQELVANCRINTNSAPGRDSLRNLSAILSLDGDIHFSSGDRSSALASYSESLEIRRRILSDFGPSPQSLRDVSVSLDRVGDMALSSGDRSSALASYSESLEIARRILSDFGPSPQSLRDVFVSELKCADLAYSETNPEEAIEFLDLARTRLAEIRACGWATPQTEADETRLNKFEEIIRSASK